MRTYSGRGHPRLVKCSYEVGLLVVDRGEVVEGATQPPGVVVPVDPSGGCDNQTSSRLVACSRGRYAHKRERISKKFPQRNRTAVLPNASLGSRPKVNALANRHCETNITPIPTGTVILAATVISNLAIRDQPIAMAMQVASNDVQDRNDAAPR